MLCNILREKTKDYSDTNRGLNYKKIFIVAMILSVNFGLGWIFGLLVTTEYPEPLYITFVVLFSLFVGLQGCLIFFLQCIRNQIVRRTWKMWFYVVCCCQNTREAKMLSKLTSGGTGMTPAATPAIRRKIPSVKLNNSTQMQQLSSLAKKYSTSVIERDEDSIGDPLNDFDTTETFIGTALTSPISDFAFFENEGVDGKIIQTKTTMEGEDMLGEKRKSKKMSKKESKKKMKKEKDNTKSNLTDIRDNELLGGSNYSLGSLEDTESQVIQIEYRPPSDSSLSNGSSEGEQDEESEFEDDKDIEKGTAAVGMVGGADMNSVMAEDKKEEIDDDEWLKQQYRDIHNILDKGFSNIAEDDPFSGEVLY